MPIPEELMKSLGNPGIWAYVKEQHYDATVAYLDEKLNEFHDKERGEVKVKFKDFHYKDSITKCDFTNEDFSDEDVVIGIWRVDKKYKKPE